MAYRIVSRNPNTGRHAVGARVGKFTPNRASQGPSGNGVGGGKNVQTGANAEYDSSQPRRNDNAQAEDWLDRPPEPFANPQPSANPRGVATNTVPGGTWQQVTSAPGNPPTRAPGRAVPSQSAINTASGHAAGYKPAGQSSSPLTSGFPKASQNKDNGGQPVAKQKFKTNADIFNQGLADYKKWGG